MRHHITLMVLFTAGVVYRLWIGGLVAQPFVFDQTEYHNFAVQILDKGLVAWQARLYGYPLFLAVIYKIFGIGNFFAVGVIQSIIDCLTAVLIYMTASRLFNKPINNADKLLDSSVAPRNDISKKIARVSYLLYLFNPFTAVYAVLTLSEVWGVFLMAGITYLLVIIMYRLPTISQIPSPERSPYGHLSGGLRVAFLALLLGYLPQVRPAFLFYSLTLLGIVIWVNKSYIQIPSPERSPFGHLPGVLIAVLLCLLPFTYNILGNWVYFRQLAPTTVDNLFVREFYISLYVSGRSPFHASSPSVFPKEVQAVYNEYSVLPKNSIERKVTAQKYLQLGLAKVFADPMNFVITRFQKFWYVWEKHFIYYYVQPENRSVNFLTYWGNNLLLLLGFSGFITWYKTTREKNYFWFKVFVVFTIFYISAVHSFSLTEERYSLPGYPLVFLFAGYGVWNIIKMIFSHPNDIFYDSSF